MNPLSWMMPEQLSTTAHFVDTMFYGITWLSIFFFVGIVALMLLFIAKYRRKDETEGPGHGATHNLAIELTWTIIPSIMVIFIFYWGLTGWVNAMTPPENAYEIDVTARQWSWTFTYPNGEASPELHTWAGQPVKLNMTSEDVLHGFFVPVFRVKNDVVPGKYSSVWFQCDEPGRHRVLCTEYCGTSHSTMLSWVEIHPTREDYEKWLETADKPQFVVPDAVVAAMPDEWFPDLATKGQKDATKRTVGYGLAQFSKRGCAQCHNLFGDKLIGPSWSETASYWGKQRPLADGSSVLMDKAYITESIYRPNAKIAAGYQALMSNQAVRDEHVDAYAELIKRINDLGEANVNQILTLLEGQ